MGKFDTEIVLYRKFMEFAKLLNIYLNHFPRHEKYALANRIRNTAYEVYELIMEGQKRYYKKTTLTNLDITHEKLRMQIYLAYELGYFRFKDGKEADKNPDEQEQHRLTTIGNMVDELGRIIGGWIKKIKDEKRWD
jgi:four helix bundle protein